MTEISYRDAFNTFCDTVCLNDPAKIALAQSAFYACHKEIMSQLAAIPNPWKEAVINEAVLCEIGWDENNPRKSLQDIISWHVAVALDPKVSSSAQALIQYGAEMATKRREPDEATFDAFKPACAHANGNTAFWDYVRCNDCGAVHVDSDWGIAKFKWFKNIEEARFYKEFGRYPE